MMRYCTNCIRKVHCYTQKKHQWEGCENGLWTNNSSKKDCYNFDCEENINGSCKRYNLCVNQCGIVKKGSQ